MLVLKRVMLLLLIGQSLGLLGANKPYQLPALKRALEAFDVTRLPGFDKPTYPANLNTLVARANDPKDRQSQALLALAKRDNTLQDRGMGQKAELDLAKAAGETLTADCLDGACLPTPASYNQDFAKTVTSLGAVNDTVGETKTSQQPVVFQGEAIDCRRRGGRQWFDCCNKAGSTCTAGERQVVQARRDHRAVSVGRYCKKYLKPWGCLAPRESFCVFASPLAAVVQRLGRAQLKRSFGVVSRKTYRPDCAGLSAAAISQIHFDSAPFAQALRVLFQGDRQHITGNAHQTPATQVALRGGA